MVYCQTEHKDAAVPFHHTKPEVTEIGVFVSSRGKNIFLAEKHIWYPRESLLKITLTAPHVNPPTVTFFNRNTPDNLKRCLGMFLIKIKSEALGVTVLRED